MTCGSATARTRSARSSKERKGEGTRGYNLIDGERRKRSEKDGKKKIIIMLLSEENNVAGG
jgi:hypothetical protein